MVLIMITIALHPYSHFMDPSRQTQQRTKPHLRRHTGLGGGRAVTCPTREVLFTQALLAQTLSVACDTVTGHLVSLYIKSHWTHRVNGHLGSLYMQSLDIQSNWTFRVTGRLELLDIQSHWIFKLIGHVESLDNQIRRIFRVTEHLESLDIQGH